MHMQHIVGLAILQPFFMRIEVLCCFANEQNHNLAGMVLASQFRMGDCGAVFLFCFDAVPNITPGALPGPMVGRVNIERAHT